MEENKILSLLLPFTFSILFQEQTKVKPTVTKTILEEHTTSTFRKLYHTYDYRILNEEIKNFKNIEFRAKFFNILRQMVLRDFSVTHQTIKQKEFADKLAKIKQQTLQSTLETFFEKNLNGIYEKEKISWGNFLKFKPLFDFRAGNSTNYIPRTDGKVETKKVSKEIINLTTRLISLTTSLFSWKEGESMPENLREVFSTKIESKKEFFQRSIGASIAFIRKYRPFIIVLFLVFMFRTPLLRLLHNLVENIKFVQKKIEFDRMKKELGNLKELFDILEKEIAEKRIDAQVDEKVISKLKKDLKNCQNKEN